MKMLFQNRNGLVSVLVIFATWRIYLLVIEKIGIQVLPVRTGYLGQIPWANFDGVHYLSIAEHGYFQYEQAFFPLFPLLIRFVSQILKIEYVLSGLFIVHFFLLCALFLLWKLVRLDYNKTISFWTLLFFLSFPTSFFFGSIYTESLFLAFVLGSFYAARKKKWFIASLLGAFASGTRFTGILLLPALITEYMIQSKLEKTSILPSIRIFAKKAWGLIIIPLGLLLYMIYLAKVNADPFFFVHSQPAFGAGRSGGDIILLPQVFFRYFKIFTTVSISNYDYWIALLEICVFSFVLLVLYLSYRACVRKSYIVFSLLSILIPTFSGTFSSMPRYALSSFVIFIFFATIHNTFLKYVIFLSSLILQTILSAFFLQGHFVS